MVMIIGHRGYSAKFDENTLPAFKEALQAGAVGVELDVHVSADGQLVVVHDDNLQRVTGVDKLVSTSSWQEIEALRTHRGERIPSLEQVLDLIYKEGGGMVLIELKAREAAPQVVDLIESQVNSGLFSYEELLVISFDVEAFESVRKLSSKVKCGATIADSSGVKMPDGVKMFPFDPNNPLPSTQKIIEHWKPDYINPSVDIVDRDWVQVAQAQGVRMNCWTVNTPQQLIKALDAEVDCIITDQVEPVLQKIYRQEQGG